MFRTWLHRKLWQSSPFQRQRRPAIRRKSTPLRLEPLEDRLLLSTYLVTNTNDSGAGSLRQAILNVDNGSGGDTIAFNIAGGGVQTIQPTSALPAITESVTIDGTTQPGYSGTPLIVVNGSLFNNGPNGYGFDITASNVTVRGLDINGFTGSQIRLAGAGNDVIAGNCLGTDVTGTQAVSGSRTVANEGIDILSANNTIGGTTAADRNLISGNYYGVSISGTVATGNLVEDNYIGTDVSGANPLANSVGVQLNGPDNTVVGNVISGNGTGLISTDSVDNVIQGNLIGTDATGTKAVANGTGVELFDDINCTIGGTTAGAGNLISGNKGIGINLETSDEVGFPGLQLEGNYIGSDVTGTKALGNATGIVIGEPNVLIGGTTADAGNLISGNTSFGVLIEASGVKLEGNLIGTDVTGTKAMGNQTGVSFSGFGIKNTVIGGTEAGAGNVISGNSDGLDLLSASGTLVEDNLIGTDITGTKAVANSRGILCETANNTIGGTAAGSGNVISGNLNNGVELDQGATGNLVQGNRIGTDVTGTVALGNGGVGIAISSSGNTIGGTTVDARNVISANQAGGIEIFTGSANLVQGNLIGTEASGTVALGNFVGVIVTNLAGGNTIGGTMPGAGNVISGNQTTGVLLSGSDTSVQGNLIGTDITGTKALGNQNGLVLQGSNNIVGGTATGARNVISGNVADGVLSGGTDQVIEGNYIGTDITGTQALGNGGDGISAGSNTTIGVAGAGNLISANGGNGISLAGSGNLVQGNSIGTDITSTQALGNGDSGVSVTGSNNTIGGTSTGAGNLISANGGDGIDISGACNVVQGNLIGTDVSGTAALGNGGDGIAILNGSDNTVGGTTSAAANVISANGGSGILISGVSAMSNLIAGNFIGTDLSATVHLGNATDGVTIQDASNNTIGGTAAGVGNTIAYNGNDGVLVDTGTGNAILSDLIFANGNLGIELINNGNDNQAAPRLLSAVQTGSGTKIVGMLRSTPNTTFTVQLFSDPSPDPSGLGEGQQLLGTFTVTTNPGGIATFVITIPTVVPTGQIITATATDPNNNTSEFSSPAEVKG